MPDPARFPTAPPPTDAQFREGLAAIWSSVAEPDRQVLLEFYRAPDHRSFSGEVARRLGIGGAVPGKRQGAVNLAVGRIARKLCDAIGFAPESRDDRSGDRLWSILFEGYAHADGRFAWRLHPGLVAALEELGWAEPEEERPEPLADELPDAAALPPGAALPEGGVRQVTVNVYERSPVNRRACLAARGAACAVCAFDFGATYGPLGEGFIHVHHLAPLAAVGEEHDVDPATDLVPVCPNCHAMLHRGPGRQAEPLGVEELKALMRQAAAEAA
ncbi:HNH endonuclease [Alienimonas sp. DA493]|uniref:HNH endonuclease n=1 Tax=Alienimonas sp. DA493 TaxID=3373605 RepID=UPI0037543E2F